MVAVLCSHHKIRDVGIEFLLNNMLGKENIAHAIQRKCNE
jgi:hypothetical protein